MKDIYFIFDSSIGALTIRENDYRTSERLRVEATLLSHSQYEPFSQLTPLQYSRLLLKTTAETLQGESLSYEELKACTDDDINAFAILYAKSIQLTLKDQTALVALYEAAKNSEHFYYSKADKIKSPFSLSTTLSSLHTTEQPVESTLRHYWDNNQSMSSSPTSKKLSELLSFKKSIEEKEKELQAITLYELYDILIEQNDSQFKRDFETKRTVNRNLKLAVISLIVGLSNLAINIMRLIESYLASL